ncbi:MAG: thiol-disulfide isomerase/thioredoxin [Halioglobus sp.]|jgi:thiol-disulfide isomerase/thioredoxin
MTSMKRSIIFIFLLSISLSSYAQGIEFVHVKWQEAMEMAKEQNKLLFVDSYAEWCGPCKRMAKNEFVKADVGTIYNENFINLKLDMESKNGRTFDSQYPVSAYPTMFFLDGEGKVVKKIRGGQKGEQLIAMAKQAIKGHDTSGKYKEKYDTGDRSYDVVYSYVDALSKSGKPSLRISNMYLKSNPEITEEQKLKFYHVAAVDADSGIFDKMVENKSAIIALVGAEAFDKKVKSACKSTLKKAVEYETEDLLEEAIQKSTALTVGAKEYGLTTKMTYAKSMKNSAMYASAAKDLSKIYFKGDIEKVNDIILTLHKTFGTDNDMLELSKDLSKKYFKKAKSVNSALAYSKTLMLLDDYKKAKKVLEKGVKNAKKAGDESKALEMMLKVIESKKA